MSPGHKDTYDWFATCPKGVESLLAQELTALGAETVRESVAGVAFSGPRVIAYRACLWSRLANRVLLQLTRVDAAAADDLYHGLLKLDWGALFDPGSTIAIDFIGQNQAFRNTQFGAQRCKDAVGRCWGVGAVVCSWRIGMLV